MLAGNAAVADDPLVDAVRILATAGGAPRAAAAARLTGVPEDELRRLVLAYRHGGAHATPSRGARPRRAPGHGDHG
jgi:hypothetical protein